MNCMPWIKLYGHLPSSLCLARLAQLLGQGLGSLTVELPSGLSGLDRKSITNCITLYPGNLYKI